MQEQYGYPPLTEGARRRIFGLNAVAAYGLDFNELLQAARHDPLAQLKEDCRNHPNPSFQTFGPRTRREFLRLQRPDGRPG